VGAERVGEMERRNGDRYAWSCPSHLPSHHPSHFISRRQQVWVRCSVEGVGGVDELSHASVPAHFRPHHRSCTLHNSLSEIGGWMDGCIDTHTPSDPHHFDEAF